MPRNIPGKILREAPPGPEMSEAEFRSSMEKLAQDAARWRHLSRNFTLVLDLPLETWTGAQLGRWLDESMQQNDL